MDQSNQVRTASQVLLDLEEKIDTLSGQIKAHDLNIRVLSNKLNSILEILSKQSQPKPSIGVPTAATQQIAPPMLNPNLSTNLPGLPSEKKIPIATESHLMVDPRPMEPRRNSRETPEKVKVSTPKAPEIVFGNKKDEAITTPPRDESVVIDIKNSIPVKQRVLDSNKKTIFLADVEIIDTKTNTLFFKTRTNGVGKWSAPLPVGKYRIFVKKQESLSKKKMESIQEIIVDGSSSMMELPDLFVK